MKMKNNKFYYKFVYKSLFTNPSFAEICSKAVQLAWCQHVLDAQHCAWCQLSTVWLSARANLNSGKQQVEIMAQLEGQQRKLTCSFSYDILSRKMSSFSTNMARNKYSNIQHQVDKLIYIKPLPSNNKLCYSWTWQAEVQAAVASAAALSPSAGDIGPLAMFWPCVIICFDMC